LDLSRCETAVPCCGLSRRQTLPDDAAFINLSVRGELAQQEPLVTPTRLG
jgi:hypothetical protein